MKITTEPFEEKLVTDVSARYDNSTVDFTLQDGDTFAEDLGEDCFTAIFNNPSGLQSEIRIYKRGLRAISRHQRMQRYRLDLPAVTASQEPAAPSDRNTTLDPSAPSSSQDQEPRG